MRDISLAQLYTIKFPHWERNTDEILAGQRLSELSTISCPQLGHNLDINVKFYFPHAPPPDLEYLLSKNLLLQHISENQSALKFCNFIDFWKLR